MENRHLFCFGLGYTALALAARLKSRGWRVAGTVRGADKAARLRSQDIEAVVLSEGGRLAAPGAVLAGVSHVLAGVPPDPAGDPVLRTHGPDIAAAGPQWLGYLSTTGVYGDRSGDWVDETSPLAPATERGRRRAAAEAAWAEWGARSGCPVHVFRLAGIYGPGRNALLSVAQGRARRIRKPGQVFSRIHVHDIASVLEASMARPRGGAIYNVCDDEPAPPDEVIAFACDLLGVAPPPVVPFNEAAAEMSPMARSFYAENKRVRNNLIKTELGVKLRYPSYREGLMALHEAGEGQAISTRTS